MLNNCCLILLLDEHKFPLKIPNKHSDVQLCVLTYILFFHENLGFVTDSWPCLLGTVTLVPGDVIPAPALGLISRITSFIIVCNMIRKNQGH
jgi:hypothetical protein